MVPTPLRQLCMTPSHALQTKPSDWGFPTKPTPHTAPLSPLPLAEWRNREETQPNRTPQSAFLFASLETPLHTSCCLIPILRLSYCLAATGRFSETTVRASHNRRGRFSVSALGPRPEPLFGTIYVTALNPLRPVGGGDKVSKHKQPATCFDLGSACRRANPHISPKNPPAKA